MKMKVYDIDIQVIDGIELKELRRKAYDTLISGFLERWPQSMVADNKDMGILMFMIVGKGLYGMNPGVQPALPIGEGIVAWDEKMGRWLMLKPKDRAEMIVETAFTMALMHDARWVSRCGDVASYDV